MNNIAKVASIGFPTLIGLGLAWVGMKIVKSEQKLKTREVELKLKLDPTSD